MGTTVSGDAGGQASRPGLPVARTWAPIEMGVLPIGAPRGEVVTGDRERIRTRSATTLHANPTAAIAEGLAGRWGTSDQAARSSDDGVKAREVAYVRVLHTDALERTVHV